MNSHVAAALAFERQRELERAAGCCTTAAYYRRAMRRTLAERLVAYRDQTRMGGGQRHSRA